MQPRVIAAKPLLQTVQSEKGFLVPLVLVIVGVMGFIMLGVANWQTNTNRIKQVQKTKTVADSIRQKVLVQIYNNEAWAATAGGNLCMEKGIQCPDSATVAVGGPLILRTPDGAVFLDSTAPTEGFNQFGDRCSSATGGGFDAVGGNNNCPFQFTLSWTTADCVGASCSVRVMGDLKYRPKTGGFDAPLKLENFKIDFVRGKETNSLQDACTSLGGVFDQVHLKCSARTLQTVTCPDGKVLKVLVEGQLPSCLQLLAPQPPCPQGTAATGISSAGLLICKPKI
jgi:hypothetical protein